MKKRLHCIGQILRYLWLSVWLTASYFCPIFWFNPSDLISSSLTLKILWRFANTSFVDSAHLSFLSIQDLTWVSINIVAETLFNLCCWEGTVSCLGTVSRIRHDCQLLNKRLDGPFTHFTSCCSYVSPTTPLCQEIWKYLSKMAPYSVVPAFYHIQIKGSFKRFYLDSVPTRILSFAAQWPI